MILSFKLIGVIIEIPGGGGGITELKGGRVAVPLERPLDDVNNMVIPVELVSNELPPLLLVVAMVLVVMEEVDGTNVLLVSMEYEHKESRSVVSNKY